MKILYKMSITLGTPENILSHWLLFGGGRDEEGRVMGIFEKHSSFVV